LGIAAIGTIAAGCLITTTVGALLVLAWAAASRTPWRELGFRRPRSWIASAGLGLVSGAAFKLAMKAVVMPLLGAPAINAKYHYLAGNSAALPSIVAAVIVAGGFAEETVFRGYLFERLGKLLGSSAAAKVAIVLFTSALFAAGHLRDQGLAGAEQATITGLTFGTAFLLTGELWTVMIAHAAFDLAAVAIIYLDLESQVAHWVFAG
jgi:membrane protease YdiL (CAAX protease family)